MLVLTFKALNCLSSVYLKECLHSHRSAQKLRSSSEGLLAVPSMRKVRLQGTRQRAFSVVVPALWNALPSDVKEINNYLTFRRHLKAALFREVFNVWFFIVLLILFGATQSDWENPTRWVGYK